MRVVLFRHLPTVNNLNSVFLGRMDLQCDRHFIEMHNSEIDDIKKSYVFNRIFCSPLIRAVQTSNLYFPNNPYIIDRRLIERDLGDWRNIPKQVVRQQYPNAFFQNGHLNFNFTPPNGESFSDVLIRVSSFLLDVYDNHCENDDIGIVTHNGIITAVKCIINKTTSTENINFQPFLSYFVLDINDEFISDLSLVFSNHFYTK